MSPIVVVAVVARRTPSSVVVSATIAPPPPPPSAGAPTTTSAPSAGTPATTSASASISGEIAVEITVEIAAMRRPCGLWWVDTTVSSMRSVALSRRAWWGWSRAGGPMVSRGRLFGAGCGIYVRRIASREWELVLEHVVKKTEVPHVVRHDRCLLTFSRIPRVQVSEGRFLDLTQPVAFERSLQLAAVHQELSVLADGVHQHVHALPISGARGGWQTQHQNRSTVHDPLPPIVLRLGQKSCNAFSAEAGGHKPIMCTHVLQYIV